MLGEAANGLALLVLRIKSRDIWLPMGYHWAWNVTQTARRVALPGASPLRGLRCSGHPARLVALRDGQSAARGKDIHSLRMLMKRNVQLDEDEQQRA